MHSKKYFSPQITEGGDLSMKSDPMNEPASSSGAFDWEGFVGGLIEANTNNVYAECLERMEREVLVRVLRHTGGNQVQAARILGITRGSLRFKIRTLRISITREVDLQSPGGDS
jgi:two-component system, NtrC family, response regulator AtoC